MQAEAGGAACCSASHSWLRKDIREDHCLVLMHSTPLEAASADSLGKEGVNGNPKYGWGATGLRKETCKT